MLGTSSSAVRWHLLPVASTAACVNRDSATPLAQHGSANFYRLDAGFAKRVSIARVHMHRRQGDQGAAIWLHGHLQLVAGLRTAEIAVASSHWRSG